MKRKPAARRNKRILVVFDGDSWFVRRVRVIEHDLTKDEKVYRCDAPIGGAYKSLAEAIRDNKLS